MSEKISPITASTNPEKIRNVVLLGPSGSGKTTLIESLAVAAGAIAKPGKISEHNTLADFDEFEIKTERSAHVAVVSVDYADLRINFIDTPGYADFAGEVGAGMRAADAALFVVSVKAGMDGNTRLLWDACADIELPRAVVITKNDVPEADAPARLAELRESLGTGVIAFEVLHGDDVIDLITQTRHHHEAGKHTATAIDSATATLIAEDRAALVEAIVSEADDDDLMNEYLEGAELDTTSIRRDVVAAVMHAKFFPVLFTRIEPAGYGADEILDLISAGFPSPLQHKIPEVQSLTTGDSRELVADVASDLVAEVIKTMTDQYLGRISLVRVFAGQLKADDVVHVAGHFGENSTHLDHDADEKVHGLFSPFGKTLRPIETAIAGDVVALTRLNSAETGDTLSAKTNPVLMPSWELPIPLHPMALVAHAKADEDKLANSLHRLVIEDPCVRVERNPETKQTVIWTLGDSHLELVLDRISAKGGVQVDPVAFKVALRETFAAAATAQGKLVKQSGGHGQYAVVDIAVEPLPLGSGFEFVDEVVGGAVPRNYIPSVEHGLRSQMEHGLKAGYQVVDIRVRLQDGKSHSVDSSDMAFQQAGALALQEAAAKAGITMLEPVSHVEIEVDDQYVGAILSDVSARRGRVNGTAPSSHKGRSLVSADVPDLELVSYTTNLRSLSHGTGRFTRAFKSYEAMPANVAKQFLEN